jgi:LemA protein
MACLINQASGRREGCVRSKQNMARIILFSTLGVLVLIALTIGLWFRSSYNGFVDKSAEIDSQWAQVQVQYQRRYDLIPNLVESVKGIFDQEQEVFGALAEARTRYSSAQASGDADEQVEATADVESALARLLVVVENYPDLRSQQNVTQLMDELAGAENRIAVERTRFNEATRDYNRATKRFPGVIVANMFGYEERPYFEAAAGTEVPPAVQF